MEASTALKEQSYIKDMCNRMDTQFGEYIFLPQEGMDRVSNANGFPQLSQIAFDDFGNEQGHLIAIPLNRGGYLKIMSAKTTDMDMIQGDIFNPDKDDKLYIFIYAIFSKMPEFTLKLMRQLITTLELLPKGITTHSCIFTESITTGDKPISEKLGLSLSYTYQLQGETLNIFQADYQKFLNNFQ
jgi:hypothetical protein